jgi:hypothetical protein
MERIISARIPKEERENRRITSSRLGINNKPRKYTSEHYNYLCSLIDEGLSITKITQKMGEKYNQDFTDNTVYHIYRSFSRKSFPSKRKANYDLEIRTGNEYHTIFEYMRQRYTLERALYDESFEDTLDNIAKRVNGYLKKNGYAFSVSRVNFCTVLYRRWKKLT